MGKSKRHRYPAAGGAAAVLESPPAAMSSECVPYVSGGFGGNYAGAGTSPARGQLPWSTLNTLYDLPAAEQRELVRRSRALFANSGIAKVIQTIAMMVGSQTPQMASTNRDWNEAAELLLRFENGSLLICDVAGDNNLESIQPLIELLAMRDGDCFVVFTKTSTGRAAWRLYEGHVVNGQPPGSYADRRWEQGIKRNEEGRPISYWFENQDAYRNGVKDQGQEVPAYAVRHYKYTRTRRGIPALAHAINNIVDIVERRGFVKSTLKLRAMLGLAIETDVTGKDQGQRPIQGRMFNGYGGVPSDNAGLQSNGTDRGPKFESVDAAGNTASVVTLKPGQTVKSLNDDSPSPNATDFEAELLRDVAIGLQLPPQVIFWLEKQTGPMVRFTVRMAQKRIEERQAYMRTNFLNPWIAYQLSMALKSGNLAEPAGGLPDKWWSCTWQRPAELTIDVGRDGNLELKQLDAGITSLHDVVGSAGGDWEEMLDKRKSENLRLIELAKELHKEHPEIPLPQCLAMFRQMGRSPDDLAGTAAAPSAPAE
ncbi:MAG: phage portal protein [Verrucomicrobiaceae bacterium]|nr:MAG: phage portal protein [Verrucomicrobiaceae bacterium]